MKLNSTRAALLAATLLALPATLLAQTEQQRLAEAMQLQRATHNQDTAGNLDEAIAIYREIAGPRTADRALAAEAQYRLSQALLQKGDLAGASDALVQLSANYPDQAERVSELAGAGAGGRGGPTLSLSLNSGGGGGRGAGGRAGAPSLTAGLNAATADQLRELERAMAELEAATPGGPNAGNAERFRELERAMVELAAARNESFQTVYDRDFVPGGTRTVATAVAGLSWTNPTSWLRIADGATQWNLIMPSPNMLIRQGMTRESLPLGEQVTVVLTADASGTPLADGTMLGRVESIVRTSDGTVVFDRAALPVPQP